MLKRVLVALIPAGLAMLAALIMLAFVYPFSSPYNNYWYLAQAFLHGRTWIDWPGPAIDALPFGGRYYVIEAPLPALLMLPAVALWGTAANQTLLSIALGAISVGVAWVLCRRLGTNWWSALILVAFLFAGTDLFFCSTFGDVWFIAHTSAVCFTLLAILELSGRGRGWLVALWAICALESRFVMVLALPVYAAYLYRQRPRALRAFAIALIPAVLLWIGYNEARFGTPYDIGYTAWYHQDVQAGEPVGSPFQLKYLTYQLYSYFVRPPQLLGVFPYLVPSAMGTALWFTSPALALAFFARRPRDLVLAMWAATLVTAGPNFIYYVNGFAQFGMRHALDFEPFLFVLMVLASVPRIPIWAALLSIYSALVGTWGVWFWHTFNRGLQS